MTQAIIDRLSSALRQIAEQGERLERVFDEPQNLVPEFCRAVLAGYAGTLEEFQHYLWPSFHLTSKGTTA
jgi:hypothetical protein